MASTLFVIATPIGNMKDITIRALETLKSVDVILAESPKHSLRLFEHYGIDPKKLIKYNDHTSLKVIPVAMELAEAGKDIGLITDAGTPTIQDPGYRIVRAFRDRGFRVVPVPGPSAIMAALSASGMPTDKFLFLGFLPRGAQRKRNILKKYDLDATIVLYESPNRVSATLEAIADALGENRQVVVARELTKVYEEFLEGSASELATLFKGERKPKGEFVILIRKA